MKIFNRWKVWRANRKAKKITLASDSTPSPDEEAKRILAETKAKIKVKKPRISRDKWSEKVEEFPIKMVKEVSKIKWSTKENLSRKYIEVLMFIVLFAVFFALVDWGFQALFSLIKVI